MKQKVFLLMLLALGMCSTMGFAQEKEYNVEDDGYEWYRVKKVVNGQKRYGAEDRYGNVIVPTEYDFVHYDNHFGLYPSLCVGFQVIAFS